MIKPLAIGIDPGNVMSALATYDPNDKTVHELIKVDNDKLIRYIATMVNMYIIEDIPHVLAIEQIRAYGMAVGATVFDTVHWSGRFQQRMLDVYNEHGRHNIITLIPRKDVKMHLCHTNRAKDTNVNQSVADRFGGMKACKGTKKKPGPLYGIAGDMWAALAVALTLSDNLVDGRYVENSSGQLHFK